MKRMYKGYCYSIKVLALFFLIWVIPLSSASGNTLQADICIYGGTSAGIIAAYTAAKQGKSVVIVEPSQHLGGMSSGGLGYTDIGNKYVVKGLALDFYRKIGQHYGKFEQWIFEPKIADSIFRAYIKESNVRVIYGRLLTEVNKTGTGIDNTVVQPVEGDQGKALSIKATIFLDCSYEGDLMAKAGVSYHVGR